MQTLIVNNVEIQIERKAIKNLHLSVYPPDGRVHVSAPLFYSDEKIQLYINKKWAWITAKRTALTSFNIQSPREYVLGEAHYFKGQLYRLKVNRDGRFPQHVEIVGDYITVTVRPQAEPQHIEGVLYAWYKEQVTPVISGFVEKYSEKLGVAPDHWEVKRIGQLAHVGNGRDYKHLKPGNIPVYGTGGYMTSVNDFLYDGETVCIGRKGTIDKPFYHSGKIWTVDTLFYTYDFTDVLPKFLYYKFWTIDWLSMNEASGVPSLTSKNIANVMISLPTIEEQKAIANILNDMDEEIVALEAKRAKYEKVKQGMMQELLSGRIRLINN